MISSIVVTQNPVASAAGDFQQTLITGSPMGIAKNSYIHEIRDMGFFWMAQFDMLPDRSGEINNLNEYLENGLSRQIQSFTEDGILAWEGEIVKMTLRLPSVDVTVSLRQMANRVWTRFIPAIDGAVPLQSAKQNDTNSQNRFGIKEYVIQGGIIENSELAANAAKIHLDAYKDPRRTQIQVRRTVAARDVSLRVECEGFFRRLFGRVYNQTATQGYQDVDAQIQTIVDDAGDFVNTTNLTSNPKQVSQFYDSDLPAGDAILNIARQGDQNSNRHIVGMYENRELRYEKQRLPG